MNNISDFAEPHCRPNILTLGYSNPLQHCKNCSGSARGSDKEVKTSTWPPNSPDPNMIKHRGDVIEQLQSIEAPHWVRHSLSCPEQFLWSGAFFCQGGGHYQQGLPLQYDVLNVLASVMLKSDFLFTSVNLYTPRIHINAASYWQRQANVLQSKNVCHLQAMACL